MSEGPRSAPPSIDGLTHLLWLGGGGFADVFLYRQDVTGLEVAVKVLLDRPSETGVAEFHAEATRMASVSEHPFIVDIQSVGIANDGRPYLVMKYYGDDNLERRARTAGRLGVDEVLRLGVQISSAVHTAHLASILHRDIKPANVLLDRYGNPGLTDFGVAAAVHGTEEQEAISPHYTAKEILEGSSAGDVRSDVYALGATLFRLLGGRPPFEYPGVANDYAFIVARAINDPVPALGVDDVPPTLERLLRQAMHKEADQRPESAEAFAKSLQVIERARGTSPTPLAVTRQVTARSRPDDPDDPEKTSRGRSQVIDATGGHDTRPRAPAIPAPLPPAVPAPGPAPSTPEPEGETVLRDGAVAVPDAAVAPPAAAAPQRARTRRMAGAATAAAVVAVVGVIVVVAQSGGGGAADPAVPSTTRPRPTLVVAGEPPVPTGVVVTVAGGQAVVTWSAPAEGAADKWVVHRTDVEGTVTATELPPRAVIPDVKPGERVCVEVSSVRGSLQSAASQEVCSR